MACVPYSAPWGKALRIAAGHTGRWWDFGAWAERRCKVQRFAYLFAARLFYYFMLVKKTGQ